MNSVCVGSPGGRTRGRESDRGLIKIGFTTRYQTAPRDVAGCLTVAAAAARHAHRQQPDWGRAKTSFRRLKIRGEWHRAEMPLLDFIEAEAVRETPQAAW